MENAMPYVWLALAVIMGILEGATSQLVSVWFVIGAIAAVITSLITPIIWIQLAVFTAVTAIALAVTRPLVKNAAHFKKTSTNSDRNVGKTAVVTMEINNREGRGQVKIDGQIWTARSASDKIIPESTSVVIEKIDGVKLIVSPLPSQN